MKRTPLKRKTRLRPMSAKRQRENKQYLALRKAYLKAISFCEACRTLKVTVLPNPAQDIHHVCGRTGDNYLNTATWMAVCRPCHEFIHSNPSKARQLGLLQ